MPRPRRRRLSPLVALASALALLAFAPTAWAGSVAIEFDFSASELSLLGGVVAVPPDGSVVAGPAVVTVSANGPAAAVDGPASLEGLSFDAMFDSDLLGQGNVIGSVGILQLGVAAGSATVGLGDADVTLPAISLDVLASIDCAPNPGAACDSLGASFPAVEDGISEIMGSLSVIDVNEVGLASIDQSFDIELAGLQGVVRLVGTEVGRTFVPEPSTALMLGLGLLVTARSQRR